MRLFSSGAVGLCAVLWIACLGASQASAQNSKLAPKFGATKLTAGFTPDPRSVSVTAGGPINTKLGGVSSFISDAPSFKLTYTAKAGQPLSIYARATGDTTILIKLPNGKFLADNDSGNSRSPHIRLTAPASGEYDIWVGTTVKSNVAASLWFSASAPKPLDIVKVDPKKKDPVPTVQETITVDNATTRIDQNTLSFRFRIDPPTARVTANWHWSIALNTPAGASSLGGPISQREVDTLQQVNIPNGTKGPIIIVVQRDNPFSISQSNPIDLPVTAPDPSLQPTAGSIQLRSGFTPNPFTKGLTAGGKLSTNLGGYKTNVTVAPTYKINFTAGNFPLTIKATSTSDTTLLVQLPDGSFRADDDSGGFPNPQLRFERPLSGQYTIWVGTFGTQDAQAKLIVTEEVVKPAPPPPPPVPDVSVSFTNRGAYVARCTITWTDENGKAKSYRSDNLAALQSRTVNMSGKSTNIRITAEYLQFFAFSNISGSFTGPGSYSCYGTTFNPSLAKD